MDKLDCIRILTEKGQVSASSIRENGKLIPSCFSFCPSKKFGLELELELLVVSHMRINTLVLNYGGGGRTIPSLNKFLQK